MIGTREIGEIRPGSFSKNYGFERYGAGFRKLRDTIRAAFPTITSDVDREYFRKIHEEKFASSPLIPLNFFLFNSIINGVSKLLVDELVVSANSDLPQPHFDMLAYAAFHLNCVGTWHGAKNWQSRPTSWAALFITTLDHTATWNDQIDADAIEKFLTKVLVYDAETPRKFATNYAAYFHYANFYDSTSQQREQDFLKFGQSSAFLLLDRQSYSMGRYIEDTNHEDWKYLSSVLGIDHNFAAPLYQNWIKNYKDFGGIQRFSLVENLNIQNTPISERNLLVISQEEAEINFALQTSYARTRASKIAYSVKKFYNFTCQFCNVPIYTGIDSNLYCEAAHIKPLGRPHLGPDVQANILALCPNHHIQLDRGTFAINKLRNTYITISRYPFLSDVEINVADPHFLRQDCLDYHRDIIAKL